MKGKVWIVVSVLLGLCALTTTPARAATDVITIRNPQTGEKRQYFVVILEENYTHLKVKFEEQNEVRDIPIEQDGQRILVDVQRRPVPQKYAEAMMAYQKQEYAEAFESYKASAAAVAEYPWLPGYIRFHAADAAFKEAKYAQFDEAGKQKWYGLAAEQFDKLLKEHPKHRFAPDAHMGLARSLMRQNQFDRARAAFTAIENSDYPSGVREAARVWAARLLVEEANEASAREKAEALLNEAIEKLSQLNQQYKENRPELAYLALLSEGYAWQGLKKYPKAEDLFEQVGLRSPDDEMRAEAFNSRGLSLMNRGDSREALLSFLRVVVLHYDIDSEYQRALYYAAKSSKDYYGTDQRFKELRQRLQVRFPNSHWTKLAEQL